jgi:ferritin
MEKEEFTTFEGFKGVKILEQEDTVDDTIELEGEGEIGSGENIPAKVKVVTNEVPVKLEGDEEEEEAPKAITGGIIKPKTLPEDVISLLNERIGDEYKAHFFYRNAANWCKDANYNKAGKFFEGEALNELEHSKGLQDYLIKWNTVPTIPSAPTTESFGSLADIINKAYELEYTLLMKYSTDLPGLLSKHAATFNFIQGYVNIQDEEVSEYSDLLNALELINVDNKLDVLFFEKKYF